MDCREISELVLPELADKCPGEYSLILRDLADDANFEILLGILEAQGDESNEKMYMVLNGHEILGGKNKIETELIYSVRRLYRLEAGKNAESSSVIRNEKLTRTTEDVRESAARRVRAGAVALAGFLDGINPCVFATLIFFMSLLIASKVPKQKLIVIGLVYTLACFLTYFLLGMGLFRLLGIGMMLPGIRPMVNGAMVFVLLVFAFLSFRDALRFYKSGNTQKLTLQLPDHLKERIHSWMRKARSGHFLIPVIFLLGVMVTLLETVCTGQVYVPTLMLLIRRDGMISGWIGYLLLYNLMFIVPLLAVFLLTYGGITLGGLLELGKKHLTVSKIMLSFLFLLLAGLLFFFEFIL